MKTKDLLNLSPKKIVSFSEKDLRKVVSTLRSTARKRYERLAEKGFYTIPMKTLSSKSPNKADVLPGIKTLDVVSLRNEYKRYNQFLNAKTSTVSGARKAEKQARDFINELAGHENFTDEEMSEIYKMAGDMSLTDEISKIVSSVDKVSSVVEFYSPNKSKKEILKSAKRKVKQIYEHKKRGEISTSEYWYQDTD